MNSVIHVYSSEQAIRDGVLRDISKLAKELGFRWPVAITANAWNACVSVPEGAAGWQDETGRLWDVLNMFRLAAKKGAEETAVRFSVLVQNSPNTNTKTVQLIGHCGPGDDGSPVLTVMLPEDA